MREAVELAVEDAARLQHATVSRMYSSTTSRLGMCWKTAYE